MEWLKEAIEWIMKYSTQGDDSQAKKKCINPLKGMLPGQIIYVGEYWSLKVPMKY